MDSIPQEGCQRRLYPPFVVPVALDLEIAYKGPPFAVRNGVPLLGREEIVRHSLLHEAPS
jgi:hypothetical protein